MDENDQRRVWSHILTWTMLGLFASGVFVKTAPLASKRPQESDRGTLTATGRQDIEARLWDDPFTVMRGMRERSAEERCKAALDDAPHHPNTLARSIAYLSQKRNARVSVLAVMIPSGPYFDEAETRRRFRYAVVQGLLQSAWTPFEGDKLGYIWTLESCVQNPWQRRTPEVVPYEWFCKNGSCGRRDGNQDGDPEDALLVVWIDEDAVTRRPLAGMETLAARLSDPEAICRAEGSAVPDTALFPIRNREIKEAVQLPRERFDTLCNRPNKNRKDEGQRGKTQSDNKGAHGCVRKDGGLPLPWCRTIVLGPMMSGSLAKLAEEVSDTKTPNSGLPASWLRFYSSGATAADGDVEILSRGTAARDQIDQRIVRLTATDDVLARALLEELDRRLVSPYPGWELTRRESEHSSLCGTAIAVIGEGDSSYARFFVKRLKEATAGKPDREGRSCETRVHEFRYLRGLDGALPDGQGAAREPSRQPDAKDETPSPAGLIKARTAEHAEGSRQYDYLTRLADELVRIDERERQEGRDGIRGIGILGSDVYDKLLILDALRPHFRRVIFFTSDLDARFVDASREGRASRNLVVASAFALQLAPEVQGANPPFRDSYQTGLYLSTRIALDPRTATQNTNAYAKWFDHAQLFEIGRSQPVSLSGRHETSCRTLDGTVCDVHPDLTRIRSPFRPLLDGWLPITLAAAAAFALVLLGSSQARARFFRPEASLRRTVIALLVVGSLCLLAAVLTNNTQSPEGEPFLWTEGVSTWPTQMIRLATLGVIGLLLWIGRDRLVAGFDAISERFRLPRFCEDPSAPGAERQPASNGRTRMGRSGHVRWTVSWLWWSPPKRSLRAGEVQEAGSLWDQYLNRMCFSACATRTAVTSALFVLLSVSLLALDWPNSPHRGQLNAWVNHTLFLLVLAAMSALLFAALDAQAMTRRFLDRLNKEEETRWPPDEIDQLALKFPIEPRFLTRYARFKLAVEVATEVSRFIYLPFIVLPLVFLARSTVFDAWDLPLPYFVLLIGMTAVAVSGAIRLRSAANALRSRLLRDLELEIEKRELQKAFDHDHFLMEAWRESLEGQRRTTALPVASAPSLPLPGRLEQPSRGAPVPSAVEAECLARIESQVRAVTSGPFRPFMEEPVVRAVLAALGGTGGITVLEAVLF